MSLIMSEIQRTIEECESNKKYLIRESERIKEERKAYDHIKHLIGVIEEGGCECLKKV